MVSQYAKIFRQRREQTNNNAYLLDELPHTGITFLRKQWLAHLPENNSPLQSKSDLILIQLPDIENRIIRQSASFMVYISAEETKKDEFVWNYSQWLIQNRPNTLRKLMIPGQYKPKFLAQLRQRNINHNMLFPDLSGLGQYLTHLQWEWLNPTKIQIPDEE